VLSLINIAHKAEQGDTTTKQFAIEEIQWQTKNKKKDGGSCRPDIIYTNICLHVTLWQKKKQVSQ